MLTKKHDDFLKDALKNPESVVAYLNASLEEAFSSGDFRHFLLALRDVATVHGVKTIAQETKLNRESLYKMFSEKGNPELSSLWSVLKSMDLRLSIEENRKVG